MRIRALVAVAALVPGCSFFFVRPPEATRTETSRESDCTTSLAPPIADSILAGVFAVAVCTG
jgi:hypothetical protein